jgi:hypothetical protein
LRIMQLLMAFLLKKAQKTLKWCQDDFDASHIKKLYADVPPVPPRIRLQKGPHRQAHRKFELALRFGRRSVPLLGNSVWLSAIRKPSLD